MNPDAFAEILKQTDAALREQAWFADGWTLRQEAGATWLGLQLSKAAWFNHDGHGIHFETWLSNEVLEAGAMTFQCHVMHAGMTFPGTEKKAAALSRPLMRRHADEVAGWGYHLPSAPGMTAFSTRVAIPVVAEIPAIIVRECSRFATLGASIDAILAAILAGKPVPKMKATATGEGKGKTKKAVPVELTEGIELLPPVELLQSGAAVAAPEAGSAAWSIQLHKPGVTMDAAPATADAADSTAPAVLTLVIAGKARHGYDARLVCSGLALRAGVAYRVRFEARANERYRISGNILQADKPHLTVGFFPGLTIETAWKAHTWDFTATLDEANTAMVFALAKQPNTVQLRGLSLRELTPAAP